jgi:hypothetical protein
MKRSLYLHKFYRKECIFLFFLILPFIALAQPANNSSCTPATIISGITCTNTAGTLFNSTASFSGALNDFCGDNNNASDVWYRFQAQSVNPTIQLSGIGTTMDNAPNMQLFNDITGGGCGTAAGFNGVGASIQCVTGTNVTSLTINATGLTIGDDYLIRIYHTVNNTNTTPGVAANWNFNICITDPWTNNDLCSNASVLTSSTSCTSLPGTLVGTTATAGGVGGCGNNASADVWYSFVAQTPYPTINLSNVGANLATASPRIQLLSGGPCGGFVTLACFNGTSLSVATAFPTGLTIGTTYRIRITTNTAGAPATNGGFSICVQDPTPAGIDFGKSYINITRGSNGGTVNPGDTLEIRATFVVKSINAGAIHRAVDSVAFYDTLFNTRGLALVPGTLALRSNEGFIFGSAYSDAFDGDNGHRTFAASDTFIRINIGAGASNVARGELGSYSSPSFYDQACIIMATYRVRVYAGYGSKINFGGGAFTYRDSATTLSTVLRFPNDTLVVYNNPGLCADAISISNAVVAESNGTFGTGSGSPILQNAPASLSVPGYIYDDFDAAGGPNDYYYGIANNTSARYTTANTANKPDGSSPSFRVNKVWDITGDHTNASNPTAGNPPCDINQPVSASNPCGYMLVINSAYKTDVAFNYSVSNLCPNTYYEISAWLKNICSKCACDVDGDGASVNPSAYNPNVGATTDSSGVKPNLAFKINGIDYYTTGNISYTGTSTGGLDANNTWIKKGFTYLTGPSETSFTLTLRNNAPGGGGNDWALDDISVATCLPTMEYSPGTNPTICAGGSFTLRDTIRSFFNNYDDFKWQRSIDGGGTWSDISGSAGVGSPSLVSGKYQYVTTYTIPPAFGTLSNTGNRYRVIVGTTSPNLSNLNCNVTDGTSIVTLNIIDCGTVLKTNLLSFNGNLVNSLSNLNWTATSEDRDVKYVVERSADGIVFTEVGTVNGYNNSNGVNTYNLVDQIPVSGKAFYRLAMVNASSSKKYSRIISLALQHDYTFQLNNVINPFKSSVDITLTVPSMSKAYIEILDMFGKSVKSKSVPVQMGINIISIPDCDFLPSGTYILKISNNNQTITTKILKRNSL